MRNNYLLILALIFNFSSVYSHAWSDHHFITEAALKEIPALQKNVQYVPLEKFIAELNYKNIMEFNRALKINTNYKFINKLSEDSTATANSLEINILKILATYSDEPDWGMDQELFNDDQFPELWKSEFSMMGGKKGLPSQAFRHMYWVEWNWKHPLQTFKLPLDKINIPLGEAPQRAEIFAQLAKKAFELKYNYWGWRFLANAFHYIEDLSQPYHTSQLPSKLLITNALENCTDELVKNEFYFLNLQYKYLEQQSQYLIEQKNIFQPTVITNQVNNIFNFLTITNAVQIIEPIISDPLGILQKNTCPYFIDRMTHLVSYYHYAFEDSISLIFKSQLPLSPDVRSALNVNQLSVSDFTNNANERVKPLSAEEIAIKIAHISNSYSEQAGQISIRFFMKYSDSYYTFNPDLFMNQKWWSENQINLQKDTEDKKAYLELVQTMFSDLGSALRGYIQPFVDSK